MNKSRNMSNELSRLDEVLSIYGANAARWPEGDRDALSALVKGDAEASRLFGEAAALDKVMAYAPTGKASEALRNRIVAAAVADGARDALVVPISAARGGSARGFGGARETIWSATAMAACFALGIYLGIVGTGGQAIGSALDLASLEISAEEADSIDFFSDSNYSDPEGLI